MSSFPELKENYHGNDKKYHDHDDNNNNNNHRWK
jgi:hypothetical protein